jgi:hypothetical protein
MTHHGNEELVSGLLVLPHHQIKYFEKLELLFNVPWYLIAFWWAVGGFVGMGLSVPFQGF